MIKLELDVQTLQAICAMLAEHPFKQVAPILDQIQKQVDAQQAGLLAKREHDAAKTGNGATV